MNVQTRFSDKLEWVEHHGRLVLRKAAIDPKTRTVTIFKNAIRANYPNDYEARLAGTIEAARARALGDGNWDEDEHPRDEDGKFTVSGGGSTDQNDGAAAAVVGAKEPELHPEAIDVTGDEWNKQTAIRLEKEYQTVKPDLEALIHKNVGAEVDTAVDEDDLAENAPVVPDSWDMLSNQQQEDVKDKWIENSKQEFLDSEISNWQENGGAKEEASHLLANSFDKGETEWADETIKEWMEARAENGNPVPYTSDQILESISVKYDGNGEGTGDVEIEFDDEKLKLPQGFDPNQGLLPGIEEIDPASYLSIEMRDELTKELERAFDKKADSAADDVEPPDYLSESVDEYQDEYWDQKDDHEKWQHAVNDTDIINEAQQAYDEYFESNGNTGGADTVAIPDTFDPLQTEGGSDYKKTHALVTFMSRERGYQLLEKRGLLDAEASKQAYMNDITKIDNELWRDWKSSSAGSFGGQILQLASHEELGARYRDMPTAREALIEQANKRYKEIGGFNGIKAMVRAKWETSQYALDKAGIHSLPVYRGLKVDMPSDEPVQEIANGQNTPFARFTNARISRNGAYSTTTDRSVANGWNAGSGGTKVVLRIDAPRTAVLSFPAYGINVHAEKEVVLAGTAFRNWDAWRDRAPGVGQVPIQHGNAA